MSNPDETAPLNQLAALFDLSLDIERHYSDTKFTQNDGTIHYVFDENLFELFVYPSKNWHRSNFFSAAWRDFKIKNEQRHKTAGLQSALITAEILFSGKLPGQANSRIFLSEWHRSELLSRMDDIIGGYSKSSFEAFRATTETAIYEKFKMWLDEPTEQYTGRFHSADVSLQDDVDLLRKQRGLTEETIAGFCRNREAALLLASDMHSEPVQQLFRILEPNFQRKLGDVATIKRPTRDQLNALQDRSRTWMKIIRDEVQLQHSLNKKISRSPTSIWNDARSIALVEWLSTQVPTTERVVFVTGDQTLFDAYRRAYENLGYRQDRRRAFFLRRVTQYSPMFSQNLDSKFIVERNKFLQSVKQTTALALLPVRLAAIRDTKASNEILRRRHSLTVIPIEEGVLQEETILDKYWRKHQKSVDVARLRVLKDEWEAGDRTLLGLSRSLLLNRLSNEEVDLFKQLEIQWGPQQEKIIREFINTRVEALNFAALNVWKPDAMRYIQSVLDQNWGKYARRIPWAIIFQLEIDDAGVDFGSLLFSILKGHPEGTNNKGELFDLSEYLVSVFDIFLAASLLSLVKQEWKMADNFSRLAIDSFEYSKGPDKVTEERVSEAYYLSAMSKRFRMGELDIMSTNREWMKAEKLYKEATSDLIASDSYGINVQRKKKGDERQFFSCYRVNSERAALNLFYAFFNYEYSLKAREDEDEKRYLAFARSAHKLAKSSLMECLRQQKKIGRASSTLKSSTGVLGQVKRQLLINIAAWHVIGYFIYGDGFSAKSNNLTKECLRHLNELQGVIERDNESKLFAAEIFAFKILCKYDEGESLQNLQNIKNTRLRGALALDKRLFNAIIKCWT